MKKAGLTIGGFTQPSVAKSLIENPQGIEEGLVQRILWIIPKPLYSAFTSLESANSSFCQYLGKSIQALTQSIMRKTKFYTKSPKLT